METVALNKQHHDLIASDRVEGTPVCRPGGPRIGTLQRLMIDKRTGTIAYAVIKFGGFLGVGEKHLRVPWTALTYNLERESYEADISDEDVRDARAMEGHEDFDWGDRTSELMVRTVQTRHYWGI